MGAGRLSFQLRALKVLSADLAALRIPLLIEDAQDFAGCTETLLKLVRQHQISHMDFIEEYPYNERLRDRSVSRALRRAGVQVTRHVADTIVRPGLVKTAAGKPYTVFTPFYKRWINQAFEFPPLPGIEAQSPVRIEASLVPEKMGAAAIADRADVWPAGEVVAGARLREFIEDAVENYEQHRDIPALGGTSRLSAHLAIGGISARQCLWAAHNKAASQPEYATGCHKWITELAWRDFYRHIAAQFDHINKGHAFRLELDRLPWRLRVNDLSRAQDSPAAADWHAWCTGHTGYPLVDAAMRQLNQTGWMHNRLRMVVAMFLTKHLLIDWRCGERYFMHTLIDGDFASNNGGWQWSASTGTDAAPYFRIFNPASQGEKFDPNGEFVHAWVPELRPVAGRLLFKDRGKWPQGVDYPLPVVEHRLARQRALEFFKQKGWGGGLSERG